jgi:hypothetical protein
MSDKIKIEVAYATPEKQKILPIMVAPGTTAEQAVAMSGISLMWIWRPRPKVFLVMRSEPGVCPKLEPM